MTIVKNSGYTGHVDVEFEGPGDSFEGIAACKALLEKLRTELA